jgi:hypothetical protein
VTRYSQLLVGHAITASFLKEMQKTINSDVYLKTVTDETPISTFSGKMWGGGGGGVEGPKASQ